MTDITPYNFELLITKIDKLLRQHMADHVTYPNTIFVGRIEYDMLIRGFKETSNTLNHTFDTDEPTLWGLHVFLMGIPSYVGVASVTTEETDNATS